MKAKKVIALCNGRHRIAKGRFSGCYVPKDKQSKTRLAAIERQMDREARDALVEGHHPAATIVPKLEPVDLRNTVVSCGLSRDDDTDGNVGHIFIPVHVPRSSGSCSHRKAASKPPIKRDFRPTKRQLMPIDEAIRRSA